ncbi:MAG: SH3 domain-containing protein [Oscillospiraceae bacterium]|jgi:uncharacterized protein YgiM (DUF1202 family)|nr:SH3 domain-containing protein [Oscillospiraceae bacterium]
MIMAKDLAAKVAEKVRTPAIPYALGGRSDKGTDCINLVGWCVQELGGRKDDIPRGSNSAWKTSMQATWTLQEAQRQNKLIPGTLVYIRDAPTPKWPDGDYGHVGVYVGRQASWAADQVIVHASASRGGVYPSTLKNAWTHAAWLKCINYDKANGGDSIPPADGGSSVVAAVKPDGGCALTGIARVTTSGSALNIRKNPSTNGGRLGTIPNGTLIDVNESQGDWIRTRFNSIEGWVSAQYLTAMGALNRSSDS